MSSLEHEKRRRGVSRSSGVSSISLDLGGGALQRMQSLQIPGVTITSAEKGSEQLVFTRSGKVRTRVTVTGSEEAVSQFIRDIVAPPHLPATPQSPQRRRGLS